MKEFEFKQQEAEDLTDEEKLAETTKSFAEAFVELTRVVGKSFEKMTLNLAPLFEELSKIKLPEIKIPNINIDMDNIEKTLNSLAKKGWTLEYSSDITYINSKEIASYSQYKLDEFFVSHYEDNNNKNFNHMKTKVLNGIDDKWKNTLSDCFELYENDKYRVIIPLLCSMIEGMIIHLMDYDEKEMQSRGYGLTKAWKKKIEKESNGKKGLLLLTTYSLIQYLMSSFFTSHNFDSKRPKQLNRNWVLHGRDNPELWTKVDALKLFNKIATFEMIKGFYEFD